MSLDKVAQTNCPTVAFLVKLIHEMSQVMGKPGLEVIKLEYRLRLKINRNDWLLACSQAANHCDLF